MFQTNDRVRFNDFNGPMFAKEGRVIASYPYATIFITDKGETYSARNENLTLIERPSDFKPGDYVLCEGKRARVNRCMAAKTNGALCISFEDGSSNGRHVKPSQVTKTEAPPKPAPRVPGTASFTPPPAPKTPAASTPVNTEARKSKVSRINLDKNEVSRTYLFKDSQIKVNGGKYIVIRKSGSHEVFFSDGNSIIVSPGWNGIAIERQSAGRG